MAKMPDNSVDSIVTDPPYGLKFMGKEWDKGVPPMDYWQEALRILKPGGHLLSFGGSRTYHRMACAIEDAGFEIRDQIMWVYGSGFPKSLNVSKAIHKTAGVERKAISEAKQWEGWGTALKPAHEPIVVARKPFTGTVANNVLAYGTGAMNIDGCRVETDEAYAPPPGGEPVTDNQVYGTGLGVGKPQHSGGRWPANFIHDGSDEVLELFPNAKGDNGSAARFFYCAKANKKERNAGLEEFESVPCGVLNGSANGTLNNDKVPISKNHHPTVKPLALMRYLVRLVTPPNGTVLDPFLGSGTTAMAAVFEGFGWVGCEITDEYVPIAEARIAWAEREVRLFS